MASLVALLTLGCKSTTKPVLTKWEGDLIPKPPSTVTGLVAAVTQFGRTETSIQIQEAEEGVTYSWRIEKGTCQADGTIQGGLAQYPPLTPGPSGSATANAVLATQFRSGEQFAAKVFRTAGGGETLAACGELVEVV